MIYKNLRPLLAAFFMVLVVLGCKKNREGVGTEILPGSIILIGNRLDTLTLRTHSTPDDSVRSDRLPNVMLGEYNDPIFGLTKTGFYTQVRLSTNEPSFTPPVGYAHQVDSVVLALEYSNSAHYGYKQPQNYRVYEVSQELFIDSLYYTNRTLPLASPENLALIDYATQRPAPTTTVVVGNDTVAPQLRLPLNTELGERLMAQSGTGNLSTSQFTKYFKGLYVTVENSGFPINEGGIHYFNLLAANSKLTIYYKEYRENSRINDTINLSYDFVINDNAVYFTKSSHDYSTAVTDLTNQFTSNPELGQQNLYTQNTAGVKVKIDIPHLNTLKNDTMAINKAILIIPYKEVENFGPPERMFMVLKNEDGSSSILPDQFEGDAHVDGYISTANKEYHINISRWVQQILNGERENYGLELFGQFAATTANRAELYGPENIERKMELIIDYTKY